MDEEAAYLKYANLNEHTISAWCASYEMKKNHYEAAFARLTHDDLSLNSLRLMYPVFAKTFGNKFSLGDVEDFSYFFCKEKSRSWQFRFLKQKLLNRLKISRYL